MPFIKEIKIAIFGKLLGFKKNKALWDALLLEKIHFRVIMYITDSNTSTDYSCGGL